MILEMMIFFPVTIRTHPFILRLFAYDSILPLYYILLPTDHLDGSLVRARHQKTQTVVYYHLIRRRTLCI